MLGCVCNHVYKLHCLQQAYSCILDFPMYVMVAVISMGMCEWKYVMADFEVSTDKFKNNVIFFVT